MADKPISELSNYTGTLDLAAHNVRVVGYDSNNGNEAFNLDLQQFLASLKTAIDSSLQSIPAGDVSYTPQETDNVFGSGDNNVQVAISKLASAAGIYFDNTNAGLFPAPANLQAALEAILAIAASGSGSGGGSGATSATDVSYDDSNSGITGINSTNVQLAIEELATKLSSLSLEATSVGYDDDNTRVGGINTVQEAVEYIIGELNSIVIPAAPSVFGGVNNQDPTRRSGLVPSDPNHDDPNNAIPQGGEGKYYLGADGQWHAPYVFNGNKGIVPDNNSGFRSVQYLKGDGTWGGAFPGTSGLGTNTGLVPDVNLNDQGSIYGDPQTQVHQDFANNQNKDSYFLAADGNWRIPMPSSREWELYVGGGDTYVIPGRTYVASGAVDQNYPFSVIISNEYRDKAYGVPVILVFEVGSQITLWSPSGSNFNIDMGTPQNYPIGFPKAYEVSGDFVLPAGRYVLKCYRYHIEVTELAQ